MMKPWPKPQNAASRPTQPTPTEKPPQAVRRRKRDQGSGALAQNLLSIAFTGYARAPMRAGKRWLVGVAALPIVAPDPKTAIIGLALASPVVVSLLLKARSGAGSVPA
jgi:hypothetical protein